MEFIANIRKLPTYTEAESERHFKKFKSSPGLENLEHTKTPALFDDGKANVNSILANDQKHITSSLDDIDNDLLRVHKAARRIYKWSSSQSVYDHGNEILENTKRYIPSLLEKSYRDFNYDGKELLTIFPICKFYQEVWNHFKFAESALYPICHGLNRSVHNRVKVSKPNNIIALNSISYPVTEIQILVCQIFIDKFVHANGDKLYGMQEFDGALDASVSRLCKSLKALLLKELSTKDALKESNKVVQFYLFLNMLERNNNNQEVLLPIFQKSYFHTLKTIKRLIYTDVYYDTIFEKLEYIKNFEHSFTTTLSLALNDPLLTVFNGDEFKILFAQDREFLSSTISTLFLKFFNNLDNEKVRNQLGAVKKFYEAHGFDETDWTIGALKFVSGLYQSLEIVNEDKLKEMVKLFTSLTEIASRIDMFSRISSFAYVKDLFQEELKTYWSKFKRDFAGHYAFCLDYKLKLVSKSKDRNKLENELEKMQVGLKTILGLMNTNSKVKFKRMYVTQFVQRMLGSLLNADFTLYTNISDCELEMCTVLDDVCKGYHYGEPMLEAYQLVQESYKRYKEFGKYLSENDLNHSGIDEIDMVGLPEVLNLSTPFTEIQFNNMVLPLEMGQMMKEFKRFYKNELRRSRRYSEGKLIIQPNYHYSRMTIDYTPPNGIVCHINCNMYQGMILTLFDDDGSENGLVDTDIATKLNIPIDIVLRCLNALGSTKFPILVKSGDHNWKINIDLEIPQKVINSGNTVTITEKKKAS
ncbi:hypothetical protein PICMEDRAFT_9925 [Pichia membranifaciens NRRL Y-2026]|uniref:Cullin family profile domain-containing protein n=1 Tax=Pichia membranifaciens NRRL Y-2026 TaxID=763406 RepID=A0A1E3NTK6_9ASCO|nr:hypothetical protein PICMEDRAFT_9925 [Pichia membranifaciens NRRL Y-2026]ODQ49461.1 hypothetical protein PICMEDRAFT_9925 [Pichia membranifaciens NRRL Y-2026]